MERRENSARRNQNFRPQRQSLISSALSCRHLYQSMDSSGLDIWLQTVQIDLVVTTTPAFFSKSFSVPTEYSIRIVNVVRWWRLEPNITMACHQIFVIVGFEKNGRLWWPIFFIFILSVGIVIARCPLVDLFSSRGKKWAIIQARKFQKKQVRRLICFLVHFWTLSNMTHISPIAYCFLFCR